MVCLVVFLIVTVTSTEYEKESGKRVVMKFVGDRLYKDIKTNECDFEVNLPYCVLHENKTEEKEF